MKRRLRVVRPLTVLLGIGMAALLFAERGQPVSRPTVSSQKEPPVSRSNGQEQDRSLARRSGNQWQALPDGMFSAPQPPALPPPQPPAPAPPAPPPPPPGVPPPPDPLADYAYVGTVQVGDQTLALIENRKTKEGWYVGVGEAFQNFPVVSVASNALTLQVDGASRTLARNEEQIILPLDKGAIAANTEGSGEANSTQLQAYDLAMGRILTSSKLRVLSRLNDQLSEKEIAHLKNEVFEGRMSAEEYQKRVKPHTSDATLSMRAFYSGFGAERAIQY